MDDMEPLLIHRSVPTLTVHPSCGALVLEPSPVTPTRRVPLSEGRQGPHMSRRLAARHAARADTEDLSRALGRSREDCPVRRRVERAKTREDPRTLVWVTGLSGPQSPVFPGPGGGRSRASVLVRA